MILQALVKYYETLLQQGKMASEGWCQAKVSYAVNLREDGSVKGIMSLKQEEERGKKTVWIPAIRTVPEMVSRSSGICANFLCDNSKFMLGIDTQGSGKRVQECFDAAKEKHLSILNGVESRMAKAVKAFFCTWDPKTAKTNPRLQEIWEDITDGGNLIFVMDASEAQEDEAIRQAWQNLQTEKEEGQKGICLVTGRKENIARIHTKIKGVQGAQSSGASLVSFNEPAFESYGKKQSYNASVGEYAAFAYTTALNYLLSQQKYVFRFGDTTVVFWAESGEKLYQDVFRMSVRPVKNNQEVIRNVFENLRRNQAVMVDDISLDPEQQFYILGLAPNAARLSVRFFYQNNFGMILENLRNHYSRMQIVKPQWKEEEYLGIDDMLFETVNQNTRDKNPLPNLPGGVLRAVLSDSRYPENLYSSVIIRIRAEQGKITYGRAAIIKACLIQNYHLQKEGNFVALNQETNDTPYVLGRMFALLEAIQKEANGEINTTIRDKYFNAACANPATIFSILMKLKNSHIRKIEKKEEWKKIYYEKQLTELMGKINAYPKMLTLEEQGRFILGYYHQVQKKYEKREEQ